MLLLAADLTAGVAGAENPARSPERVISLVPAITETLFALGLGPRVVGVSTYCDHPAEAAGLPKVGTFTQPVAETIVALRPDLVLTSPSPGNESAVRALQRSGIQVAVVQSEGGLGEARAAMLAVADAVGRHDAGVQLVAAIDARIESVRVRASSQPPVAVAIVIGREPLVLAGPASYLGELSGLAGGRNIAGPVGGRWPQVGVEFLVAAAPEVLVDLSTSMEKGGLPATPGPQQPASTASAQPGSSAATPSSWSHLRSIPAVASGRVVTEGESILLRPGPRLAEAAERLLEVLHPALARTRPAAPPGGAPAIAEPR